MKIGLFADAHYSSAEPRGLRQYNQSMRKMEEALQAFAQQGCELAVFLGDLIDNEPTTEAEAENLRKIAALWQTAPFPIVCMLGNHDAYSFTRDDFYALIGAQHRPETRTLHGKTLLFLDACYYADGSPYLPPDGDWTDTFLPDADALRRDLAAIEGEAVIFLHQNIDPEVREDHCLSNAAEVRAILEQSGKVRRVYQGHYHPGKKTEYNGIFYHTLPAMCEQEKAYWIHEI